MQSRRLMIRQRHGPSRPAIPARRRTPSHEIPVRSRMHAPRRRWPVRRHQPPRIGAVHPTRLVRRDSGSRRRWRPATFPGRNRRDLLRRRPSCRPAAQRPAIVPPAAPAVGSVDHGAATMRQRGSRKLVSRLDQSGVRQEAGVGDHAVIRPHGSSLDMPAPVHDLDGLDERPRSVVQRAAQLLHLGH